VKHHRLKCNSKDFQEVWLGFKTFEVRVNDRDYKKGDLVSLLEWSPGDSPLDSVNYSGRTMDFVIGYIIQGQFGLPENMCVFQIHAVTPGEIRKLKSKNRKTTGK